MSAENLVSEFVKETPPFMIGPPAQPDKVKNGVSRIIQLSTNENPYGISPLSEKAMIEQASLSNRYPDVTASKLRGKLAQLHGISASQIMVTEGATAGLGFIAEVFFQKGDEVILAPPTYPNYYNYANKQQCTLVEIPMFEETYTPDFDRMLAAVTDRTKAVFLCNPNNPTGTVIDSDELHAFQRRLPGHVLLVVDEAYIDFVDIDPYTSMVDAIADGINLIVVRTFSKLYGMAGARVGYLMSNDEIINYLVRDTPGYCCNRMGLFGAQAALDDIEFQNLTIKGNKEARRILVDTMEDLGFKVWPSHTNFIYFDPGVDTAWFENRMLEYGVAMGGNLVIGGAFEKCRISIGTPQDCAYAANCMRALMKNARNGKNAVRERTT